MDIFKKDLLDYIEFVDDEGNVVFGSHSIPSKRFENTKTYSGAMLFMNSDPDISHIDKNVRWFHGHQHWNYTNIEDQIDSGVNVINLDSGCVYGKSLIAVSADLKTRFEVKAKKVYATELSRN